MLGTTDIVELYLRNLMNNFKTKSLLFNPIYTTIPLGCYGFGWG